MNSSPVMHFLLMPGLFYTQNWATEPYQCRSLCVVNVRYLVNIQFDSSVSEVCKIFEDRFYCS